MVTLGGLVVLAVLGAIVGPEQESPTATEQRTTRVTAETPRSAAQVAKTAADVVIHEPAMCDNQQPARLRWFAAPALDGKWTPKDLGFEIGGGCDEVISERMLSCSLEELRSTHGDSPYLHRAYKLGFTDYRCEPVSGGPGATYPLSDVVGAKRQ